MSLLKRVQTLNKALPHKDYYRFITNQLPVGYVDVNLLDDLDTTLFEINSKQRCVSCNFPPEHKQRFETDIAKFFRSYFQKNKLKGWRNELFPVGSDTHGQPLFVIERAALSLLGISGKGVHVNGYIDTPDGIFMWIAKRAMTKTTEPGKLDQIAAGGLPYGISAHENVIKECSEEASIPRELAMLAQPVSAITSAYDLPLGLRPDIMLNYDLALPSSFTPHTNDGEVESFTLMHINEALTRLETSEDFKFNSGVVIIDFAIRHGIITPEHPDYIALCSGMFASSQRLAAFS